MDEIILQTAQFQMTQMEFITRLLTATGIGLVIGLEREFSQKDNPHGFFAGTRTFALVAILGFIAGLLGTIYSEWVLLTFALGVVLLIGLGYFITASKGAIGSTTEFSVLLCFGLGLLSFLGYHNMALAITVIVTVILSLKMKVKKVVGKLTQEEIYAFVQFVVMALLIIPFLPNENFGPYDVINPREIGMVVLLTSGISFVGYILMKFLGANKGILITGLLGGLVSSTAVTWNFSKKSKETPELSMNYAVGILAAACIMIARVFLLVYIFNKAMLTGFVLPLVILFAAAVGITAYFNKKQNKNTAVNADIPLGDPLNLKDALFFGLLYTGILILVSYANAEYGSKGIYISSLISGLTDIDAITISVSKLAGTTIDYLTAQNAVLIATLSNTVVKIGISISAGSPTLRKKIIIGYGVVFIAGIIGFAILNL